MQTINDPKHNSKSATEWLKKKKMTQKKSRPQLDRNAVMGPE